MIRWTVFLCLSLFLALQIGGEDRGQKRLGLIQGEEDARLDAERAARVEKLPPPVLPAASPVSVTFASAKPLIAPPVEPRPAPAEAEVIAVSAGTAEDVGQVMYVSGRTVNVRSGPSTRKPVVGKLTRGEAVSVVWVEDNGWARIRVEGDGVDGYMSADFLTETQPGL